MGDTSLLDLQNIGISALGAFGSLQLLLLNRALWSTGVHFADCVVSINAVVLPFVSESFNCRSDWVSVTGSTNNPISNMAGTS
jgi:hypothetical protein